MPAPLRVLAAALLAAVVAGGCGGHDPNAPARRLAEDDQRWAEGALPRAQSLPPGWSGTADDRGAALDDCAAVDRSALTLTGEAVASFELGEDLAAVAGTQVFATPEDARALVESPGDDALAACLAEELAEMFADEEAGRRVEAIRMAPADAPDAGEAARSLAGEGVYVAGESRRPLALEVVWLQRDRGALTLVTAALDRAFPSGVRDTLLADFDERTATKPPPP